MFDPLGDDPRELASRVKEIGKLEPAPPTPPFSFRPAAGGGRAERETNEGKGPRVLARQSSSPVARGGGGCAERTSLNCRWCCLRAVDKVRSLAPPSAVLALSTRDAKSPLVAASGCSRSLPRAVCSAAAVVLRSVVFSDVGGSLRIKSTGGFDSVSILRWRRCCRSRRTVPDGPERTGSTPIRPSRWHPAVRSPAQPDCRPSTRAVPESRQPAVTR